MSACARGCCWSPFSCGTARTCACHWEEWKPGGLSGSAVNYRDPTSQQAIYNIEKGRRGK